MTHNAPALMWFRQDLRLADNPALVDAARTGRPLIALFILDDVICAQLGGATRWWLHHSLTALARDLAAKDVQLILRHGDAQSTLMQIASDMGISSVHWNRCYDGRSIERDTAIKSALKAAGLEARSHNAALLNEPWVPKTKSGGPFKVFTPFWKHCLNDLPPPPAPIDAPEHLTGVRSMPSDALDDWGLLPKTPDWAGGLREAWLPGEAGAQHRLRAFLEETAETYAIKRDFPGTIATSRLSPHLRFGEISPRQIFAATRARQTAGLLGDKAAYKFLAEVGWREFSHALIHQFPNMASEPFKAQYQAFPWQEDSSGLIAWQKGMTGYPIVDAGMRELWHTGYMHNRVRMIAASFLVKDIMVHWRHGLAWFDDTLVDACPANNPAGWQWVAGCGADAAPYFRIFNPISQGEKFDPDGAYVRKWIPELKELPDSVIHKPWTAAPLVLRGAGVELGKSYPKPMLDHAKARDRALQALKTVTGK